MSTDWDRENVQQRLAAGVLRGAVEIGGQAHLDFVWADTRVYSQYVIKVGCRWLGGYKEPLPSSSSVCWVGASSWNRAGNR